MTIKGCGLYCGRVYIGNQTKGNFYSKNHKFTKIENTTSSIQNDILAVVNSYLGLMRHFSSYKIRKRQVLKLLKSSKSSFYFFNEFLKISKKSCLKNPVFVSKTAQLGVQMKSRNESFGFFVFRNA